MGIPIRLKEERLRLGFTQESFAALAGATKKSQINWEQGVAMPNAGVLSKYAEAGADVLYILTGQRSAPVQPQALLPPRLRALVDNYENTDEEGRRIIEGTALFAAERTALGHATKKKA